MKRNLTSLCVITIFLLVATFGHKVFAQVVDESKYVTLTVKQGDSIRLDLCTFDDNNHVRIVSGTTDTTFPVVNFAIPGTFINYYAGATEMKIYGNLRRLNCNGNFHRVTGIDASHNATLEHLECNYDSIVNLNVSQNSALKLLECKDCMMETLILGNHPDMENIYCGRNELGSLNVKGCPNLEGLYCENNKIKNLDVSGLSKLRNLNCENNLLTNLDIKWATSLYSLSCSNNKLSLLNVTPINNQLKFLECYGNPFSTEELNKIMCGLPLRPENEYNHATFMPLYSQEDTNLDIFLSTNSQNAIDKNWHIVCYYPSGNPLVTTGSYTCSDKPIPLYDKYVSLVFANDSSVYLFAEIDTNSKNQNVLIQGAGVSKFIPEGSWSYSYSGYVQGNDTMRIYGDINHIEYHSYSPDTAIVNYLKYVDFSHNKELNRITLVGNQLENLDLSGQTELEHLTIGRDSLAFINLDGCKSLSYLRLDETNLQNIDLNSSLDNIEFVAFTSNPKLATVDIGNNKTLKQMEFVGNSNIKSFNIKGCDSLHVIFGWGNKLSTSMIDDIYCQLPVRSGTEGEQDGFGFFWIVRNTDDPQYNNTLMTNGANATAKNWKLFAGESAEKVIINSLAIGSHVCPDVALSDAVPEILIVYPNPTQNEIFVSDIHNEIVKVYSIDGRLLISEIINEKLDISSLDNGTYILQVGDRQTKIVKR